MILCVLFVVLACSLVSHAQRSSDIVYLTGYVTPNQQSYRPGPSTIGSRIPLSIRDSRYSRQRNFGYPQYPHRVIDSGYRDDYEPKPRPESYEEPYQRYQEPEYHRYDINARRQNLNRNGRYYSTQLRLAKSYDYNKYNPSRDMDDYVRYRKRRSNQENKSLRNVSLLQEKVLNYNKYRTNLRDADDYIHYRRKRDADQKAQEGISLVKANTVQEVREYIYYAPLAATQSSVQISELQGHENITAGSTTVLENPDLEVKPISSTVPLPIGTTKPLDNLKKYSYQIVFPEPTLPTRTNIPPQEDRDLEDREDQDQESPMQEEQEALQEPPVLSEPDPVEELVLLDNSTEENNEETESQAANRLSFKYTTSTITNSTENLEALPSPPIVQTKKARTGRTFYFHNEPSRLDSEEQEILLHSAFDYPRRIPEDVSSIHGGNYDEPNVPTIEIETRTIENPYDYPNDLVPDEILPLSLPPVDRVEIEVESSSRVIPVDENRQYKPTKRFVKRTRKAKLPQF